MKETKPVWHQNGLKVTVSPGVMKNTQIRVSLCTFYPPPTSKHSHRFMRPGDKSPCDPANKGEALKVKLGQQLSSDHPDHEHANGPQGLYFQTLSPAFSELKKP